MNVKEYLCPCFNFPEANALAGRVAVAVCGARSLFTHVTVVPGVTVRWDGLKANPLMVTVAVLLCAPGRRRQEQQSHQRQGGQPQ